MNKLMKRYYDIKKNKKKGFTLTELIVVILVIAVLMVALAPAVMGLIGRAQVTADHADARLLLTAASVASMSIISGNATLGSVGDAVATSQSHIAGSGLNQQTLPNAAFILAQVDGALEPGLRVAIAFRDGIAIGVAINGNGRNSDSRGPVVGELFFNAPATADFAGVDDTVQVVTVVVPQ